jgi:muramoyltetrapeptide carboxypeptidase
MRVPPLLAPGARVALVSPAGPLRGEGDLVRAVDNARSFGWEPVVGAHARGRQGYFAGSDADRLADLNRALADDRVDAVWCLRGGYGAMRLLDRLDYDALVRRPKAIIGYSDITALHAAIGRRTGLVTFHGPTAREALTPFSRDSLVRAIVQGGDPCGSTRGARLIRRGTTVGRLAGGNIALLAALCGTPYFPDLDGALLVLEDVGEAMYRVDRMLTQLRLSGALTGLRGMIFGHCTDCPMSEDGDRPIDEVLAEVADALEVPCVAGVPIGHIDQQWTLPLGLTAELVDGAVHVLRDD